MQPQSFHDNRTGEDRNGAGQDGGPANLFQNDGSFMEMFKRKLDAQKKEEEAKSQATEQKVFKLDKFRLFCTFNFFIIMDFHTVRCTVLTMGEYN